MTVPNSPDIVPKLQTATLPIEPKDEPTLVGDEGRNGGSLERQRQRVRGFNLNSQQHVNMTRQRAQQSNLLNIKENKLLSMEERRTSSLDGDFRKADKDRIGRKNNKRDIRKESANNPLKAMVDALNQKSYESNRRLTEEMAWEPFKSESKKANMVARLFTNNKRVDDVHVEVWQDLKVRNQTKNTSYLLR